jgi:DNA-binding winged helix-turn-helix (wHTH) protein
MPNHVSFENDNLILRSRVLQLKGQNIVAALSKNQTLLIYCLLNKVNERDMLISYIWPDKNPAEKENSYHQLVYKTRRALNECGFPPDIILTLAGYGICMHRGYFEPIIKSQGQHLVNNTARLIQRSLDHTR